MEAARSKFRSNMGTDITSRKYSNEEMLGIAEEIQFEGKGCTLTDLASALELSRSRLSKRLHHTRATLKSLSGEMRKNFLMQVFDTSEPTGTITSTPSSLSESFQQTVAEAQEATTQEMLKTTQLQLLQEQQQRTALKKTLKRRVEERKLVERKRMRLQVRREKEGEKTGSLLDNLQEELTTEREKNRTLLKDLEAAKKSIAVLKEKEGDLQKDKEHLFLRLQAEEKQLQESDVEVMASLRQRAKFLSQDVRYLESLLQDQDTAVRMTEEDGKTFNTKTSECVMKLLDKGVPAHHVSGVMSDVARLCGKTLSVLPSTTTVNRIGDRRASIVRQQLAEALSQQQHTTLMSDETRKRGDSYEVFAVRAEEDREYVLDLRDMVDKSAETCLNTFKTVLADIEESTSTDIGNMLLGNIKNTMSDRAATEKKFHALLEDYRRQVLPELYANWNQLSEAEKDALSRMNNFYCGLHLLVNFAEIAVNVLKLYEDAQESENEGEDGAERDREGKKKEDSKTVQLIRQASKCLARGADEKSGCYQEFRTFLHEEHQNDDPGKGRRKLTTLLQPFRGNRFNILSVLQCGDKFLPPR